MRGSDDDYNVRPKRPGSKSDAARHFLDSLNRFKRSRRMCFGKDAAYYASELRELLTELQIANPSPKVGIELLAKFYKSDRLLIERCDDSDGQVGDVFRIDAQQLFNSYASTCTDKKWLVKVLLNLCAKNEYGLRDTLLENAAGYLPTDLLRKLADTFMKLGQKEIDTNRHAPHHSSQYLMLVETLARQLKNPVLFERARFFNSSGGRAGWLDIAEAFLEAGDAETALERVGRDTDSSPHTARARDELLIRIHQARGDRKAMIDAAYRVFRSERSKAGFERLVGLVGKSERSRILADEAGAIQQGSGFNLDDVSFLADMGNAAEAEAYIIKYATQLDGREFYTLPALADQLAESGHPLGASIIYRTLVEGNLAPSISKYYRFGVRYLRELDRLAPAVADWEAFQAHPEYLAALRSKHARKSRFWELYDKSARRG